MARSDASVPAKDTELQAYAENFANKLLAQFAAYEMTNAQATHCSSLQSAFSTALATANDPETRTKVSIKAKDDARKALVDILSAYGKMILANPAVSDALKLSLGLSLRAKPTPIPVPSVVPVIAIKSIVGNVVTIQLKNPDSSKRGKPKGCASGSVYSFVGETVSDNIEDFRFEGSTSRPENIVINFPKSLPAFTTVWLTALYSNPRQMAGPASVPISLNLGTWAVQAVNTTTTKLAA